MSIAYSFEGREIPTLQEAQIEASKFLRGIRKSPSVILARLAWENLTVTGRLAYKNPAGIWRWGTLVGLIADPVGGKRHLLIVPDDNPAKEIRVRYTRIRAFKVQR